MDSTAWRAIAAYLYLLGLDDLGYAWECLRRNAGYRSDWARRAAGAAPGAWGLRAFEDPALDARFADPLWEQAPGDFVLVPIAPGAPGPTFDLWSLPGPRRLLHDGRAVRATLDMIGPALRLSIARTLRDGGPFAYQLPAGRAADHRRRRAQGAIARAEKIAARGATVPARRDALVRMRTFTAYDGHSAGASQRDIAIVLFGEDHVRRGWSADSELRAQVRHLVGRGQKLVAGGYRALIHSPGDRAASS